MKIRAIFIICMVIFLGYSLFLYLNKERKEKEWQESEILTFEECIEKGYQRIDFETPQCKTSSGKTFYQQTDSSPALINEIVVEMPRSNTIISSPTRIQGRARGFWFFEGTFSVFLLDKDGVELGSSVLLAEGEWMTEDFVNFSGELVFDAPSSKTGKLVFKNANPSGLSENDKSIEIPVRF